MPLCWTEAFQVLEPDSWHPDTRYAPENQRRSCMLCGGFVPTVVDEGIEADGPFIPLASEPTSQGLDRPRTRHRRRPAGVGAVARPSTPDSALDSAPNGHSVPSTSPGAPKPTPERSTARADQRGVRDQITGLVLPESDPVAVSIPRIGVRSTLVDLGLDDGVMEVPKTLRKLAGLLGGPPQVHSARPSSPGTSLGTALQSFVAWAPCGAAIK